MLTETDRQPVNAKLLKKSIRDLRRLSYTEGCQLMTPEDPVLRSVLVIID